MGEASVRVSLNQTSVSLAKGYEVDIVCSRTVMLRMLAVKSNCIFFLRKTKSRSGELSSHDGNRKDSRVFVNFGGSRFTKSLPTEADSRFRFTG
jgi:hypothetical protein